MRIAAALLSGALLWITATSARSDEPRKWRDGSGAFAVKATFVSYEDGSVALKYEDGTVHPIKYGQLCQEDQDYISSHHLETRKWAANNGSTVDAVLSSMKTNTVVLEKRDSTLISVPLDTFVTADQGTICHELGYCECLRGNWKDALPLLRKSGNKQWKEAADKESEDAIAAAALWFGLAKTGGFAERVALANHADRLYVTGVVALEGFRREKALKEQKEFRNSLGTWAGEEIPLYDENHRPTKVGFKLDKDDRRTNLEILDTNSLPAGASSDKGKVTLGEDNAEVSLEIATAGNSAWLAMKPAFGKAPNVMELTPMSLQKMHETLPKSIDLGTEKHDELVDKKDRWVYYKTGRDPESGMISRIEADEAREQKVSPGGNMQQKQAQAALKVQRLNSLRSQIRIKSEIASSLGRTVPALKARLESLPRMSELQKELLDAKIGVRVSVLYAGWTVNVIDAVNAEDSAKVEDNVGSGLQEIAPTQDDSTREPRTIDRLTKGGPRAPTTIVGKWDWSNGGVCEFRADGTAKSNSGVEGKWKCVDKNTRKYQAEWSVGITDWMVISADGSNVVGKNSSGTNYTAKRLPANN